MPDVPVEHSEGDPTDDVLDLPHSGDHSQTGASSMPFPENTEAGNLQVAMSGLAQGFTALFQLIANRAAQLSGDSQAMWAIAMTSPTVMAAHGMRVAGESGAGRTRVEANTPASTQVVGNTP